MKGYTLTFMTKIRDSREFRDLAVQYASIECYVCVCVWFRRPAAETASSKSPFCEGFTLKHQFIVYAFNGSSKQRCILSIHVFCFTRWMKHYRCSKKYNSLICIRIYEDFCVCYPCILFKINIFAESSFWGKCAYRSHFSGPQWRKWKGIPLRSWRKCAILENCVIWRYNMQI